MSVSTFDHQLNQCINDIRRCLDSIGEISRKRHLGRDHKTTNLDELESSLQAGSSFIQREANKYPRLSAPVDLDVTDGRFPFTTMTFC
jgi:hypothetical protein